jgi:ABC-type dipeptide/oligopeptide/nickel transport system permease component
VWSAVWSRFPLTFQLIVLSLGLALLLALVVGRAAASRPGSRFDRAVLNYTLFASAQPSFFWALVAIFVFFTKLGIAPAPLGVMSISSTPPPDVTGFIIVDCLLDGNVTALRDVLAHFAIPVLLLGVLLSGPLMKMTRQGVVQASRSDYMLYARISGMAPKVSRSYLLRNSLAPVVTLTGVLFASALSGIVLIESIFSFQGLALYTLVSTKRLDFPAIQGCVLLLTFFALLIYLVMDLLYAALDPRVAYGKDDR